MNEISISENPVNSIVLILTPVISYLFFLSIHWIPFRFFKISGRIQMMTMTLVLCLPVVVPLYFWLSSIFPVSPEDEVFLIRVFILVGFTLLWCGYVQFVFAFEGSPSLRFLVEILTSPKNEQTAAQISEKYSFHDVYRRRIQRSVQGGVLIEQTLGSEKTYQNGRGASRWAVIAQFIKNFMNLGDGG